MPIKGLSDQVRLPRLGKIRLGIKVEGQRSPYPEPVDYFVCPDAVKKYYGDTPRELRIMFPTEDPSRWASQFYRCYASTGKLVCRGDGQRATALVDTHTGVLVAMNSCSTVVKDIRCDPDRCPYQGKNCRRVMNLQFLLPDIPGLGVWQLDTSSYWSMSNINSGIRLLGQLCGRVSMIPLTLKLVPRQVRPNGLKKTVHVLSLDIPGSITETLEYARVLHGEVRLPPPDDETPEDLFPRSLLSQNEPARGKLKRHPHEKYLSTSRREAEAKA